MYVHSVTLYLFVIRLHFLTCSNVCQLSTSHEFYIKGSGYRQHFCYIFMKIIIRENYELCNYLRPKQLEKESLHFKFPYFNQCIEMNFLDSVWSIYFASGLENRLKACIVYRWWSSKLLWQVYNNEIEILNRFWVHQNFCQNCWDSFKFDSVSDMNLTVYW